MSDPFIGEIRPWALDFAPRGWALCNGQQIRVAEAQALFTLIGGLYGPTDRVTFYLPDLRSRAVQNAGTPANKWVAQGLPSAIAIGARSGDASVTLSQSQMPRHTHQAAGGTVANATAMTRNPTADSYMSRPASGVYFYNFWNNTTLAPDTALHASMVGPSGGGAAHENRQPYLAVNFCIALDGVYPNRP